MKTAIVEASDGMLWGKFLVGRFDTELEYVSPVSGRPLLTGIGHSPDPVRTLFVMDLQTREGALFSPGGVARIDLQKSRVWVCPLFESFLTWLYAHPSLEDLPAVLELGGSTASYRRPGLAALELATIAELEATIRTRDARIGYLESELRAADAREADAEIVDAEIVDVDDLDVIAAVHPRTAKACGRCAGTGREP